MDVIESDVGLIVGVGRLVDAHTQWLVVELREGCTSIDGHLCPCLSVLAGEEHEFVADALDLHPRVVVPSLVVGVLRTVSTIDHGEHISTVVTGEHTEVNQLLAVALQTLEDETTLVVGGSVVSVGA